MILLQSFDKSSATQWIVQSIHYMPFDSEHGLGKSQAQIMAEGGIFVDSIPDQDPPTGKHATKMLYDPDSGDITYEYSDIPPTPRSDLGRIEDLESQLAEKDTIIAQMLLSLVMNDLI